MRSGLIRRCLRAAAAALVMAPVCFEGSRAGGALAAATACGADMRVLVISADGNEANLPGITTTLDYLGTPYTLHVAAKTPGALTADRLSSGCHANFQAVIVTLGIVDNAWSGILTASELQALHTFESEFRVRQVVWYTYPNDFGLVANGPAVSTIGVAPLPVSLTPAGAAVFPYINLGPRVVKSGKKTVTVGNPARPLVVEQAIAYPALPDAAASTTPLIKDASGNTLATATTYADGREILALTFDSNPYTLQTLLFGYGLANWATRGLFVGERHIYMSPQVDDVFIEDDQWTNGMSCALVGKDRDPNADGPTVRMTGNDLAAVAYWQHMKNLKPTTANLRLTMAFNGWGTTGMYRRDTLTRTAKAIDRFFYWVSHTYDHPMLDGIGYAAASAELTMNNYVAWKLKLDNFSPANLVTPNISGLNDPEVMQAAFDAGVRFLVTDSSQPGQGNPSPNIGIYNASQPEILMIPRRPVNLFYNVSTPEDWASEYNCMYRSFFGRDLTYDEILDFVSNQLLPYLLHGENDPWMFHQPNLVAYDDRHTLLTDLLDLTIAKYNGYFNLPILSPSMDALGKRIDARMKLQAAQVTATLEPGVSVTLTSNADVTVPITGLSMPGTESYGGQSIAWVNVKAGVPMTVSLVPPIRRPVNAETLAINPITTITSAVTAMTRY